MKLYTTLVLMPDGKWQRDDMPTTRAVARKTQRINRIIGGITTQIVPANEQEIENYKSSVYRNVTTPV